MLEFSSMAQDFVEATSSLVGGRTINIMDREGTIIASTEQERIGTFHQARLRSLPRENRFLLRQRICPGIPAQRRAITCPSF